MSRWLLVLLAFSVLPSAHAGDFYNGNDLMKLCRQDRATLYIAGFVDKATQDSLATLLFMPGEPADARTFAIRRVQSAIVGYCLPQRATVGQINDVVCKYVRENPKDRTKSAAAMIRMSLGEAFPCCQ